MTIITYRTADVDGLKIFYREAGSPQAPKLLLLHGFPSSSHMFRDLIPLLADRFHIVAPDLPGFGQSGLPASGHSFEAIAAVISPSTSRRRPRRPAAPRIANNTRTGLLPTPCLCTT